MLILRKICWNFPNAIDASKTYLECMLLIFHVYYNYMIFCICSAWKQNSNEFKFFCFVLKINFLAKFKNWNSITSTYLNCILRYFISIKIHNFTSEWLHVALMTFEGYLSFHTLLRPSFFAWRTKTHLKEERARC